MLFEIYIWVLCFIAVYVAVFWISVADLAKGKKKFEPLKEYPFVSICIPAWNEEGSIIRTLRSLLNLDYPKEKLEIIIVNDGSSDRTKEIVEHYLEENKLSNVKLVSQENKGKAGALNTGLKAAKGEFFGVFDADSIVGADTLKVMLPYFDSDDVGAVINPINVHSPRTFIEKMQRLEYIMTSFIRGLMSHVDTLQTTTGVLSLFRKNLVKDLGGFDEGNITEDFEIALRLQYNNYSVRICSDAKAYTRVPKTLKGLWVQRVRWFRGFIYNNLKYKKFIFNKDYGLLGMFQIPLGIFTFLVVVFSLGVIGLHVVEFFIDLFFRALILKWNMFDFKLYDLIHYVLDINWKIVFPSVVALISGIYIYFKAHKMTNEKWRYKFASFIYLFVYPLFRSLQWLQAMILEASRSKKRWR